MSCVILNTMKLCINQAQTDISGEKVLSYINGVVNIEQEGRGGRGGNYFSQSFMRDFMRPVISLCSAFVIVKWSDVLIGRHMVYKLNWGCFSQEKCDSDELIPADFLASMCVCTLCMCV